MRKKTIIFILFASIAFILFGYINFLNADNAIPQIDILKLKNGDLILRRGCSAESYAVYLSDNKSDFTHIGIVTIQNNTPYVIHAVPHKNKTIKKEKLTTFLNSKNTSKFTIYRSNYSPLALKKVALTAEAFYQQKIEFDSNYDLKNSSKLYCTELVLKAFEKSGLHLKLKTQNINILINSYQILFPSEFTRNPNFYKIY